LLPQNLSAAEIFAVLPGCHSPPPAGEVRAGKLAGELGFEPRSSVLETDSLTVELTPPRSYQLSSFRYRLTAKSQGLLLFRLFVRRVLAAGIAEL
jgi:hypothetical protein